MGAAAEGWDGSDPLPRDPLVVLAGWLDEAFAAGLQPNPHAIALATISPEGDPEVRMVLAQDLDPVAGELTFYTHRTSPKGRALAANPRAAAVFYFGPQSRQVRVAGRAAPAPDALSDRYFDSRPLDARIGAWASAQSEPVPSREALHAAVREAGRRLGADAGRAVQRPPDWGGYVLRIETVELWISGPARIHDRGLWTREGPEGAWLGRRLQP